MTAIHVCMVEHVLTESMVLIARVRQGLTGNAVRKVRNKFMLADTLKDLEVHLKGLRHEDFAVFRSILS